MELFQDNEAIAALENTLPLQQGDAWLESAVAVAWHLRQRDCGRSLTVADEAEKALFQHQDLAKLRHLQARLGLLRAEIALLFGNVARAHELTQGAAGLFGELADAQGIGDAHWLQASIWVDRGDSAQVALSLDLALAAYSENGDSLRVRCAWARKLVNASFREPVSTASELAHQFPLETVYPKCVLAWVAAARANVSGLTNNPGESIRHDLEAYQAALDSGQIRHALVSVTNAAESFATLGDLDSALEWSEQALALARTAEWPASIGFSLLQLGDVMRLLGRHDESRAYLREALSKMASQAGSRNYVQGLGNMGQLAIDVGDYQAGLDSFVQLEGHVKSLAEPDLIIKAWRGQASALLRLGRPHEAQTKAIAALQLAQQQGNAEGQIQVLRVMAQLHREHALIPPERLSAPTATLHYLTNALDIAATISGYEVSPELLEQVAAAYAHAGDFARAYQQSMAASSARARSRRQEAQQRVLALQVRQQVEQARADTEHHRKLAATLKETATTLETLGTIGREITASLDAGAVCQALHRHVHQLLDATAFAVYLAEPEPAILKMVFGIEAGVALPISRVSMNSPTALSARCARERKEVLIEIEPGVITGNWVPGTLPTYSMLYAPLMVGERLLGVMTIQSPRQHVYGERERSIFHTLCAYGAIALDNAQAYEAAAQAQHRADLAIHELRLTQARLVEDIAERERIDQELNVLNNELEARIAARTQEMQVTLTQLGESRQKLQGIVDTALDAVVRVDSLGFIVGWNRQAQTIFGWSAQEAVGRSLHTTIIPHQHREAHLQGMARYMGGAASSVIDRRIEITALHRSGREFPIELAITRVSLDDPSKYEFCSFIRDITQRRLAEEEIQTSLEKQKELNQLKSRFVSMASHEFRTPLATILSSTDLLSHYYDRLPAHERSDLFGSIWVAVRRMTKMLEDVLVIGKDEEERLECKPVLVVVDGLCKSIVQDLRAELDRAGSLQHALTLSSCGQEVQGYLDEKLMRHIFGNLLSNAVKYSPGGGEVRFEVACDQADLVFKVIDAGIGIPEADLPRLFESFHRGTNVGNIAGTGLGLAIVKRSVELHGGTIAVLSQLGSGTEFTVCLPRTLERS
jgi:PAS domain S-box-containing protein